MSSMSPLAREPQHGLSHQDGVLWDALPGMFLLLGRDGAARRMNAAFAACAGLPVATQGRDWLARLSESSAQALERALAQGERFSLPLCLRAVEGQPERWVDCAARWHACGVEGGRDDGSTGAGDWICLLHDLHELHDHQATLARVSDAARHAAHHDALTGLPNRAAFTEQLGRRMAQAGERGEEGETLALLFIDLDHFQRITDSLGHLAGDELLQAVAGRIAAAAPGPAVAVVAGQGGEALLARFGGDEFMLLLAARPSREAALGAAAEAAGRILAAIEAPLQAAGRPISVTASIGIALTPGDADTAAELIRHADTAMYLAKARGRANWQFFEPALATSAYAALVMEGELAQALERSELTLHFQPQVRTRDGSLAGAEALVRWRHPERGLLLPDEFIPLAEQLRLMQPLGAWVLREAVLAARRWQAAGLAGGRLTVAVNLSTRQFQADDFVAGVAALLRETGLPAPLLELELTERMLMDDPARSLARIAELKALGVGLSVDDFGTGHSSLGQLRELPIDKMKIDRSFVADLPGDGDAAAIARAIIQMGRSLGITVVAEGVETESQRRFLTEEACDELQGDGVSAPLAAAAFEAWAAGRAVQRP
jgi:diguanylate cyclase (GGDEF)-like protein